MSENNDSTADDSSSTIQTRQPVAPSRSSASSTSTQWPSAPSSPDVAQDQDGTTRRLQGILDRALHADPFSSYHHPESVVVVPASSTTVDESMTTTTTTTQKKKKKKNDAIKDQKEASLYLSLWKLDRKPGGSWKFNENSQSWLLQHMYDHVKVSKSSFATLVEYVSSAGGDAVMKSRTIEDAKRRARRYKEWEGATNSTFVKSVVRDH